MYDDELQRITFSSTSLNNSVDVTVGGDRDLNLEEDGSFSKISTVQFGNFPAPKDISGPERTEYPPKMTVEDVLNSPKEMMRTSMASFAMSCAPVSNSKIPRCPRREPPLLVT